MFVPKFNLVITEPAKQDFSDLVTYTQQNWGKTQSEKYGNKIYAALDIITSNPKIGRQKYECRVYVAEKHHIYYEIKDATIEILRILHERMDAGHHLKDLH